MARRGLSTLSTLRIFTTEIALDLHKDMTKNSLDTPEETKMSHLGKKNSTRGNGNLQIYSLHPHREQGDSNHDQIQDVEGVAAEGAFVHECSIYRHL